MVDQRLGEELTNPEVTLAKAPADATIREAEITLHPAKHQTLFTLYPSPTRFHSNQVAWIQFSPLDRQLTAKKADGDVTYRLWMPTTPLPDAKQRYEQMVTGRPSRFSRAHEWRSDFIPLTAYARGWSVQTEARARICAAHP